jgi:citronellyl-CoA dehydrogenase
MYFTPEQELFRKNLRDFIDSEINPHVEEWEAKEQWPAHEVLKKMGNLGFLGVTMDPAYGGQGLDYWFDLVFLEEMGHIHAGGVSVPITVQTHMATPAIHRFGNDEQKKKYLRPALAGDAVFAIGVSEPDAGSDVAGLRTTARRVGDEYVINGTKTFITNGAQADYVTMLCRTSEDPGHHSFSLIIVPTNTPGFHVSKKLKKMGWRCSDTAMLTLEDVKVPAANLIGKENEGFIYQMQQFQHERLTAASSYVACKETIEATKEYLANRKAFGKPLLTKQVLRHRLAELETETECVRHLAYHCVRLLQSGQDATREISMLKLKGARTTKRVIDECLQMYGGNGFIEEYPIARAYRDVRIMTIGGGADEIMLEIISKMGGY